MMNLPPNNTYRANKGFVALQATQRYHTNIGYKKTKTLQLIEKMTSAREGREKSLSKMK